MSLIDDVAAAVAKYRGRAKEGWEDSTVAMIDAALEYAIKQRNVFKVVSVEFLVRTDTDIEKLQAVLDNMRDDRNNDVVVDWRMPHAVSAEISGPEAEDIFKASDLVYPDKNTYDSLVTR